MKYLINRLHKKADVIKFNLTLHPAQIPTPPENITPVIIPKVKPLKPTGESKVELEDYFFELLQSRLSKKLTAKGMILTHTTTTTPKARPKGGIMDNIGKIFDCGFAMPIKHNRTIETA